MSLEDYRANLPTYAKDIKLNLGSVLSLEDTDGLTKEQIAGIALASAYATQQNEVIEMATHFSEDVLSPEQQHAAKLAATLMAMNNVYYRFIHSVSDKTYGTLPAKLRMTGMANPGVDKIDFELYSLAVSAINGCGLCMDSHVKQAAKELSEQTIQRVIRIAAVITASAQASRLTQI